MKWGIYIVAGVLGVGLLFACKAKNGDVSASTARDTIGYNIQKLETFFSYPVSSRKPIIINTANPEQDEKLYKLRLQHWYLIYDTRHYKKLYGALPKYYPGNVTLDEYRKNPLQPPDEYNKIMFGE